MFEDSLRLSLVPIKASYRLDMVQYGLVRFVMVWYGMFSMLWYGMVNDNHGMVWYALVWRL